MTITLNGDPVDVAGPLTLSALLASLGVDPRRVAVEHNLSVVANLSDTITVLARGEILAEGDYATVSRNPEVIQAYMGQGDA